MARVGSRGVAEVSDPSSAFVPWKPAALLPPISAEIRSSPQRPGCNSKGARGVASPGRWMGSAAPWAASGRGAGFRWSWSYWGCGGEVLCLLYRSKPGNRASVCVALRGGTGWENTLRQLGEGGLIPAVLRGSLRPNSLSSPLSLAPSPIPSVRRSPVTTSSCCHAFGWPGLRITALLPHRVRLVVGPECVISWGRTPTSVSEGARRYQSVLVLCCSCIKYSSSRMGLSDAYLCLHLQWKCVLFINTGEGS